MNRRRRLRSSTIPDRGAVGQRKPLGRPMRIQLNRRLKMDNVFRSTDSTTFTSGIK